MVLRRRYSGGRSRLRHICFQLLPCFAKFRLADRLISPKSQHRGSRSKVALLATRPKSISTVPGPQCSRNHLADVNPLSSLLLSGLQANSTQHSVRPYTYVRPIDRETAKQRIPSCSNLPHVWTPIHDRFIAYLATHARLTEEGEIPDREETQPRWAAADIRQMLWVQFPALRNYVGCFFDFSLLVRED